MLIAIPILIAVGMLAIAAILKRTDLRNVIILLTLLTISAIYLYRGINLGLDAQLFVLVALAVIVPIITLISIIVNVLSKNTEPANNLGLRGEIRRKAFHLVGLLVFIPPEVFWIPYYRGVIGFNYFFNANLHPCTAGFLSFIVFLVTFSLIVAFALIEFLRLTYRPDLFGSLLRDYEKDRIAAYFYSTTAIFVVAVFFYPNDAIVAAAIAMGFLADLAACIVGKRFHKISYKDRSLEGCLANFAVGSLVGYWFVGMIAIPVALVLAIVDFLNGALELKLNDNLLFPILVATLLYILGA